MVVVEILMILFDNMRLVRIVLHGNLPQCNRFYFWLRTSGGILDNFIDNKSIGRFPFCTTILTSHMWSNKIIAIPTTTRNQTYRPGVGRSNLNIPNYLGMNALYVHEGLMMLAGGLSRD